MSQQDDQKAIADLATAVSAIADTLSSLMTSAELAMFQAELHTRERMTLADASHTIAGIASFVDILALAIVDDVQNGGVSLQHMMGAAGVMQTVALWEASILG